MRDSLAFVLTFVALVQVAFGIGGTLAPPDPLTQVYVATAGTIAAAVVAVWFIRGGGDRLDATVADVWLFLGCMIAVLFVGQVFVVGLGRSQIEDVLLLATALLVAGWLAFGVDGLRETVGREG